MEVHLDWQEVNRGGRMKVVNMGGCSFWVEFLGRGWFLANLELDFGDDNG